MNRLATIFCFLFFFVGFFISELIRFYFFIYQDNSSIGLQLSIIAIAALSGILLLVSFRSMRLVAFSFAKQMVVGAAVGVAFFYALFGTEDLLSHNRLFHTKDIPSFSQLTGHCGVYAARSVIHSYYMNTDPLLENHLKDYEISNECRIHHFAELQNHHLLACAPNTDAVQCQVYWMNVFAEKGFWNPESRQAFLSRVLELYDQSKKENATFKVNDSSWMEYAIKDHELVSANSTELKQAGIEEQFSDEYLYFKQKDDVDNLQLTQKIFQSISTLVAKSDSNSPEMLKYRETEREASIQLEKLPELQKELSELGKKINYSPSP